MNDRFRFRAYDKKNKVLHYDAECTYDFMYGTPAVMHDSFGTLLDDDDFIVEQSTDCEDVHGKLIYEGDNVVALYRTSNPKEEIRHEGVVRWDGFEFVIEDRFGMLLALRSVFRNRSKVDLEIIGNIHDNP